MPDAAFNREVRVRPASYPLSSQGGSSPVPDAGFVYPASVQPARGMSRDVKLGDAAWPQSTTFYEVLIPYAGPDPILEALTLGDQVDVLDMPGVVLELSAPAADNGGLRTVWHLPCQLVASPS